MNPTYQNFHGVVPPWPPPGDTPDPVSPFKVWIHPCFQLVLCTGDSSKCSLFAPFYVGSRVKYMTVHTHSACTVIVANMIELLLKSFLVYHSPMFEVWKVPKRLVEVSCDVTQHLVAYRTAVDTRTNMVPECVHILDNTYGCPASIHYFLLD